VAATPPTSSTRLPLSLFVITLNEERNLRRCLESAVDLATEVIVVDSGSTDGTRAIAESFGARWYDQPWLGMRDQKNAALGHCTQPWVLALDADEELSPKLRAEISRILCDDSKDIAGLRCARKSRFLGRWIRHGDWYPDWQLRLFRREKGHFAGEAGHDHVELAQGSRILPTRAELLHYSYPTLASFLEKLNSFSDAHLAAQIARGKSWSLLGNVFRPWWRFFRGYILRLGFLDGFPGYWIAKATAFSAFVRHSRLYEHGTNKRDEP
jgi:glycosyltransferase involved in cell wall biosynthesis